MVNSSQAQPRGVKRTFGLDLSAAPLRAFTWFTAGASLIGVTTFALVNSFLLGDVSQSADTIAAISGFSISVSGSVVAIVLAKRALVQQDEIKELEERVKLREEERESERILREGILPLRSYLSSNRSSFRSVEQAAKDLTSAADLPRDEVDTDDSHARIYAARANAVEALNVLAETLATWTDSRLLADAVQSDRAETGWARETEARLVTSRIFETFSQLYSISQSPSHVQARAVSMEVQNYSSHEDFENQQALEEELISSAGENVDEVRLHPDAHDSRWFSLKTPSGAREKILHSGMEAYSGAAQSALPECIELIRGLSADLSNASASALWSRVMQAKFAARVQNSAVFDPSEPGGYHMAADVRRPLRNTRPAKRTEGRVGIRKTKVERTPENASLENRILETAGWLDHPVPPESLGPLGCLFVLCDPAGYFATFEGGAKRKLAKGGALPRFPLVLNRGAAILLRTLAELPSSGDIDRTVSAKLPHIPQSARRMLPSEDVDTFSTTALPGVMKELLEAPDKIFCPSVLSDGHGQPFDMRGVDLRFDVNRAVKRSQWPTPGKGKKKPKLRRRALPSDKK